VVPVSEKKKPDKPPLACGCVTLRDLFAAFALAGSRASDEYADESHVGTARAAYADADAMLAERERSK
jgi:hypothetical protein